MSPEVPDRRERDAREPGEESPRENLALLYEELLTVIVRMRAGREQITNAESFRSRTKAALQDVERDAASAGYALQDVRDTHFAIVAFLDSVMLHSSDPVRTEWERKPLQEELFGQTDAGVVFFEKLEQFRSRRDSEQLADILELYLLCLLLGFEGRYSGGLRGELDSIAEKVRRRIGDIRQRGSQLSPSGVLPSTPTPVAPSKLRPTNRFWIVTLAAVIFTILLFLGLKWNLSLTSEQLRNNFPSADL